jgi:hypothetical protein
MITMTHTIKIQHETFGQLIKESFVDGTQFKLFLKLIHGCLELKNDLDFFNGQDFLIHVPYKILKESIVITHMDEMSVSMSDVVKSKVEALVTR